MIENCFGRHSQLSFLSHLQSFVPASNPETLYFREPQWPWWYGDKVENFHSLTFTPLEFLQSHSRPWCTLLTDAPPSSPTPFSFWCGSQIPYIMLLSFINQCWILIILVSILENYFSVLGLNISTHMDSPNVYEISNIEIICWSIWELLWITWIFPIILEDLPSFPCFSGFDIAESIESSPACNIINEPMILTSTKAMHISQHELLLSFQKLPNLLLSLMFCFLITSLIISLPIKYSFNCNEMLVIVRVFEVFNLIVKLSLWWLWFKHKMKENRFKMLKGLET